MAASAKPVLILSVDSGSSSTDRITSKGSIEVQGLLLGNGAVDVSKLTAANTTIDLSQELAQENQSLTAPPGTLIAYGKKGYTGWAFRVVPESGQLAINNSTFGDPLYGVVKAAYVASSSLAPAAAATNSWEFSTDFGQTWSAPIAVGATNRFEVPDGAYAEGQVRVRQTVVTPPPAAAATGNLIQNGSFETGWRGTGWSPVRSLPGWTAADQFEVWGTGMTRPSEGSYLLKIDYSYAQDSITQTVNTVAGGTYQLEFDLKSRGGGSESVEVFWRGSLLTTVATANRDSWKTFSLSVTGSGGSDALTFREPANENNGLGALIDNVRLNAVSLPQTAVDDGRKTYDSDTLFPAFSVDRSGPQVSLETPGGSDQVVSSTTVDRTVSGKAEPGQTVSLLTIVARVERFDSGSLPSWLKLDVPNASIANIKLDAANGELDFSASGGRTNLWNSRDNAPFAWAARPSVNLNETWYIETKVRVDSRTQGVTIAGITFSNGRDGDFQFGAPSFYLDAWHQQGTHVTLQGLGNNNPFATAGGATTVAGQAATTMLRVEITEKGANDDYRFFYRRSEGESWIRLGDVYSYGVDNARAALFYKTGEAKQGMAAFDDVRVGKLSEVTLASGIAVDAQGNFSHRLSDEQLDLLGQGGEKTLVAVQQDLAGNLGRSQTVGFAVDSEQGPVRILSIGGGDGKVSSELKETGKGPLQLQLDQYTGYWSSRLSDLQNYVAAFNPSAGQKKYSVVTDAIDFTDDQGGFAGELNFDKRWPAAEALNVWGTGGINNQFFAKISGDFFISEAGKYRFRTYNDDGVFLLINGKLVINDPTLHPEQVFTGDIELAAGNQQLELFFFENGGEASLEFSVSRFNPLTNQWGGYQLVGKDPSLKAKSVVEADNQIKGEGQPNQTVSLWLGDTLLGRIDSDAAGRFTYNLTADNLALLAAAPAGLAVHATQTDRAGNTSRSETLPITLSEKTPEVVILAVGGADAVVSGAIVSGTASDLEVVGRGEPNLPTRLLFNGKPLKDPINARADGSFSFSLSPDDLTSIGQGAGKSLVVEQQQPSGIKGQSNPFSFAVDTVAPSVSLDSIGYGDGRVSLNSVELGQGPLKLQVDQYTGYWSDRLSDLQTYSTNFNPGPNRAKYSISTDAIDFTDDQGGFAGELNFDKRWPAAEALNVWGTGGINNQFFVKVSGDFFVGEAATYRFRTYNDDGVFLLIDGALVISDSSQHPEQVFTGDVSLAVGNHQLELYFFENGGEASLEFSVSRFDAATQQWGAYQLVGQDTRLKAQSILRQDNVISGQGEPNGTVTLMLGNRELGTARTDAKGLFSFSLTTEHLSQIASLGTGAAIVAVQLDAAGNRGASAPASISAKLTPPKVVITSIGGNDQVVSGVEGDAVIQGTGEPGLPVSISVNGTLLGASDPANSAGAFSYSFSAKDLERLGQGGPLKVTASQTDAWGNVGTVESAAFLVDTVAPALVLPARGEALALGGVDGVVSTQAGDASIRGLAEPDRDVVISLGSQVLATVRAASDGSFSFSLSPDDLTRIGQGAGKQLLLKQSDGAGNSSERSISFDVDTVAPDTPVITDVASGGVVSAQPKDNAISGRAEAGAAVNLLVGGRPLATVTANRQGSFTYLLSDSDIAELGQGNRELVAELADAAGNVSRSSPYSFRIDTLAPAVPRVSSVGGDDSTVSTQGSLNVTATVDNLVKGQAEPDTRVDLYNGSKLLGFANSDADGQFSYALTAPNLASIGQGERKLLHVVAVDAAGNPSGPSTPLSFRVDTVPPQAPRIRSLGGDDGVITALEGDSTISGSAEANTSLELRVLNGNTALFPIPSLSADAKGAWSYTFSAEQLLAIQAAQLLGGAPIIQAIATDDAGNRGVSVSIEAKLDITPPALSLEAIGGADGVVSSQANDNLIRGRTEPNAKVSLSANGKRLGEVTAGVDGRFSYALSAANISALGQGANREVVATQVDRAGNRSSSSASFAVDTVAPNRALIRSLGGTDKLVTARSGDHVVVGSAEAGATVDLIAVAGTQRTTLASLSLGSDSSFSYTLTPDDLQLIRQGVGKSLVVSSRDAAGNRSESSPYSFAVEAIWATGGSANNVLTFLSGVDALTGGGGADRFVLPSLASGLVRSGQTPVFDRITDFQMGQDAIDAPVAVASGQIKDLGTIQALSTTHLGKLLSSAAFPALGAAVFRQQDPQIGERTFVAINDGKAGYSSRTDALFEITGYSGSLSSLSIV